MSFTHNKRADASRELKKRVPLQERRRRLIRLTREHPEYTQQEYAEALSVDTSTVCRDFKEINEEFKIVNADMWLLSRERMLKEIRDNKAECMRRLGLCTKASQGSRWMEEWTKLSIQEGKILGINSPSHVMVHQETVIRKEDKDAAVDAAFATIGEPQMIIGEDGVISLPQLLAPEAEPDTENIDDSN